MIKSAFLLAASIAVAAPAFAAEPISFSRDGISYVATVDQRGGTEFIEGHELLSGRTFALRVRNGRVTGRYDGKDVNYDAPQNATIETASR